MGHWSGVVNSTLSEYVKGVEAKLMRGRPVWNKLMRKGKIKKYHDGGTDINWAIQTDLPSTTPWSGEELNFSPIDPNKRATVGWKRYAVTDLLDAFTQKMNSGAPALIKLYDQRGPNMTQSMEEKLAASLYTDGATYTTDWAGLPTMFTATTPSYAADRVATPNGTYGGKSTVLASMAGGTWSSNLSAGSDQPNQTLANDWPDGEGSYGYSCWSPLLLNWSSTSWVDSSHITFGDTGPRVMRQANIWSNVLNSESGRADMCVLAQNFFYQWGNANDGKVVINTPTKEEIDTGIRVYNWEGLELMYEYGVPLNTMYMLNTSQMEMAILGDKLMDVKGPTQDPRSLAWLTSLVAYGNWKFISPRFFVKAYNWA